jgi:hypothetical protein
MKKILTLLAILALSANLSFAEGIKRKITFKRGSNSATVKGSVVRGDRDEYTLGAKAGQTMTVTITSLENNAVFQIYRGANALEGAGEGDDATSWTGDLPSDGTYKIIVGGTRGNASYTLKVAVK